MQPSNFELSIIVPFVWVLFNSFVLVLAFLDAQEATIKVTSSVFKILFMQAI